MDERIRYESEALFTHLHSIYNPHNRHTSHYHDSFSFNVIMFTSRFGI